MPTKRPVDQLNNLTDQVIKKNGNQEISAVKDNSLRKDFIASFINWISGGLLAESEVGYKMDIVPTSPNAFARVDMLGNSQPITEQIWITNTPNPDDGLYHKIKVTRGVDGIEQQEDLGPVA